MSIYIYMHACIHTDILTYLHTQRSEGVEHPWVPSMCLGSAASGTARVAAWSRQSAQAMWSPSLLDLGFQGFETGFRV